MRATMSNLCFKYNIHTTIRPVMCQGLEGLKKTRTSPIFMAETPEHFALWAEREEA